MSLLLLLLLLCLITGRIDRREVLFGGYRRRLWGRGREVTGGGGLALPDQFAYTAVPTHISDRRTDGQTDIFVNTI